MVIYATTTKIGGQIAVPGALLKFGKMTTSPMGPK